MRKFLLILISALSLGAWQGAEAAPGGGGKADLTTNLHVIDSSSPPVVVGEVIGLDAGRNIIIALSPALANAEPPLLVRVPGFNQSGLTLTGTEILYYTDATCSTTPYFTVPAGVYTPTGVVATSTGVTTSYHIFKPGVGSFIAGVTFSARIDPTGPRADNMNSCNAAGEIYDAIQAEATPYSFTLTPPLKLKNK